MRGALCDSLRARGRSDARSMAAGPEPTSDVASSRLQCHRKVHLSPGPQTRRCLLWHRATRPYRALRTGVVPARRQRTRNRQFRSDSNVIGLLVSGNPASTVFAGFKWDRLPYRPRRIGIEGASQSSRRLEDASRRTGSSDACHRAPASCVDRITAQSVTVFFGFIAKVR
jgi:hypothetical protein